MENKEATKHGGLSSGFLLGVVVGVIITLLLTTKRGKKILKMITEEGMNKISNWEDIFSDAVEEYTTQPAEPKLPSVELAEEIEDDEPQEIIVEKKSSETKEVSKPIKRFFKGIHRSSIN
ncbi:MAG: YtxH domain-containing protein [Candidatus Levybacteria bacterium]|nr:YtxH domain-containing protein [Candidatus Levybacteria bacterium]